MMHDMPACDENERGPRPGNQPSEARQPGFVATNPDAPNSTLNLEGKASHLSGTWLLVAYVLTPSPPAHIFHIRFLAL